MENRRGAYPVLSSLRRVCDALKVETSVLRDAGRSLLLVYREFDAARDVADVGGDVIAHGPLRDRLYDFATSWDGRRIEMARQIEGLGQAATDAATAYERIETELVAAMAGER